MTRPRPRHHSPSEQTRPVWKLVVGLAAAGVAAWMLAGAAEWGGIPALAQDLRRLAFVALMLEAVVLVPAVIVSALAWMRWARGRLVEAFESPPESE